MASVVVLEDQVEVPLDLRTLADFRRWALSDGFPDRGRIDYLAGRIEVDMSPEDFFSHGVLKVELIRVLSQYLRETDRGYLVTDSTRVSSPEADLSAEPDLVFVSRESLGAGRVRLVPGAPGQGGYVEVEGAPDLVVEIVSRRSVVKDTRRLPMAYFKAGIPEFWLADARSEPLEFAIHKRGPSGYRRVAIDKEGFQKSAVLNCRFRLSGHRDGLGHWTFELCAKQ